MSLGKTFDPGRQLHASKAPAEQILATLANQLMHAQQAVQSAQTQLNLANQRLQLAQHRIAEIAQMTEHSQGGSDEQMAQADCPAHSAREEAQHAAQAVQAATT